MIDAGATVLRDVSVSLRELIRQEVFIDAPGDIDVELSSPGDEHARARGAVRPIVLVYLYEIRENAFLRNAPYEMRPKGPKIIASPPPAVVDLAYMIVAYAQRPEAELVLTNRVKRLFHDVALLEGDRLKGSLAATGNTSLEIVPTPMSLEELHRVWAGFPGASFHLALFYYVTPVRIPSTLADTLDRVQSVDIRQSQIPLEGSTPEISSR